VGKSVLRMHQSALSKVGSIFNKLWTGCKCKQCAQYDVEPFESVGSYEAANLVVNQSKRQRFLENNAAGVAKAMGERDPTLPDAERRTMTEGLLLRAFTAEELKKHMLLSSLFLKTFSLEARGATARGLEWSDLSVRRFPSMFGTGGATVDVLCTYVSATKTQEGGAYCLGAIGHVDPWLCPLGAAADALVATCHRPGQDLLTPPVSFSPNFNPADAELLLAGVDPVFYWAAGSHMGFRQWYCWRQFPAVRGGLFKEMPYEYHLSQLKKAWRGGGLPGEARSTHAFRRAAAQRGKEAGVSLADNLLHGMWEKGAANGVYDGLIPNVPIMFALSGRAPDCQSPITPRLTVAVPVVLQRTLCPWLEREEEAYTTRVGADPKCYDKALLDFFGLARWARSIFFQTWAARMATTTIPPDCAIHRHPLLDTENFRAYVSTMKQALSDSNEAVATAVAEVLPAMSRAVKVAVEAVAAASASGVLDVEQRLSRQIDAVAATTRARNDERFDELMMVVAPMAQELRDLRREVAALRDGEVVSPSWGEGVAVGTTPTTAAWGTVSSVSPVAGPSTAIQTAVHPAAVDAGGLVARGAPVSSLGVVLSPTTARSPLSSRPPFPVACAAPLSAPLIRDRDNVRQLQLAHKLDGVDLFEDGRQCVPMLTMAVGKGWEVALDEYATGLEKRVAIRELEALLGDRWRKVGDKGRARRQGKLYSTRAGIYLAFASEYGKRGAAVGVETIVSDIKAKYAGRGGAIEVFKLARADYPPQF